MNKNKQRLISSILEVYEKLPFNRVLGLEIRLDQSDDIVVGFDMKDELIGNYVYGILHGGVISSTLDVAGGLTATFNVLKRTAELTEADIADRVSRIGTIDLRVDYLRPGKGRSFTASGKIMRAGRKVAVTRMEMHNEQSVLIAVGTGTYIVG